MALNPNINRFYGKDVRAGAVEKDRELGGLFGKWNSVVDDSIKSARSADLNAEKAKELYFKADDIAGDGGLSLKEALKFVDLVLEEFAKNGVKSQEGSDEKSKIDFAKALTNKPNEGETQAQILNPQMPQTVQGALNAPEKVHMSMSAQMANAPRIEQLLSSYGLDRGAGASAGAISTGANAASSTVGGFSVASGVGASSGANQMASSGGAFQNASFSTQGSYDVAQINDATAVQGVEVGLDAQEVYEQENHIQENSEQEASPLSEFASTLDAGEGLYGLVA